MEHRGIGGEQPLQDGRLPQEWGEKNRQEQDYVASYIRRQLLSSGIHPTESGPYPAYAGALSHLKTSFRFTLKDNNRFGKPSGASASDSCRVRSAERGGIPFYTGQRRV